MTESDGVSIHPTTTTVAASVVVVAGTATINTSQTTKTTTVTKEKVTMLPNQYSTLIESVDILRIYSYCINTIVVLLY